MEASAHQFLKDILETPSPSGFERPVQDVVRKYAESFADEIRTDLHGNLTVVANPDAEQRLMLAGHCDQIGLIVQHIDKEGFVSVLPIGGWDPQMLIGQRLTIWGSDGPVPAIIARKPIHLLNDEERRKVVQIKDMWLDVGAATREEAEPWVQVGDPVTFELGYRELKSGLAYSPGMDDKTGLWVVVEGLRRAKAAGVTCGVYAASTVQEEIGLRGARTSAFAIDPQVAIAVDVTHATDCPTIDKKQEGEVNLGQGPVVYRGPNMNPKVVDRIREAAANQEIPYQLCASGRATGTDANAIQISRAGVATGLVSIPNRYMHSPVEVVSLADLDHAADLLAQFALTLKTSDDFTP